MRSRARSRSRTAGRWAVYTCDMLTTGFMGAEHAYLKFGETIG
jgi:hypothetical protein